MPAQITIGTLIDTEDSPSGHAAILSSMPPGDCDFSTLRNMHELTDIKTYDLLCALPLSTVSDKDVHTIAVKFAQYCAGQVVHIYEMYQMGDPRAKNAVGQTQNWLDGVEVRPWKPNEMLLAVLPPPPLNAAWAASLASQTAAARSPTIAVMSAACTARATAHASGYPDRQWGRTYLNALMREV